MKFEEALRALGRQMGLDALAPNADGVCRLVFDGRLVVDCELLQGSEGLAYLYSVLGPLPAEGREALYETLLAANLFGQGCGDATLAIDPVLGEVLIQQKIDTGAMDEQSFARCMEAFVQQVETWRDTLAKGNADAPATSSAAGGSMMMRV